MTRRSRRSWPPGRTSSLLPAPGTVPGCHEAQVRAWVEAAHRAGALTMTAIGTSQEGADVDTIRALALMAKMTGTDIHHLGDCGYYGITLPENLVTYSMTIRGRRHTYRRMAMSLLPLTCAPRGSGLTRITVARPPAALRQGRGDSIALRDGLGRALHLLARVPPPVPGRRAAAAPSRCPGAAPTDAPRAVAGLRDRAGRLRAAPGSDLRVRVTRLRHRRLLQHRPAAGRRCGLRHPGRGCAPQGDPGRPRRGVQPRRATARVLPGGTERRLGRAVGGAVPPLLEGRGGR